MRVPILTVIWPPPPTLLKHHISGLYTIHHHKRTSNNYILPSLLRQYWREANLLESLLTNIHSEKRTWDLKTTSFYLLWNEFQHYLILHLLHIHQHTQLTKGSKVCSAIIFALKSIPLQTFMLGEEARWIDESSVIMIDFHHSLHSISRSIHTFTPINRQSC